MAKLPQGVEFWVLKLFDYGEMGMEKFLSAKYWVACSSESALRIFFDYALMEQNAIDYSYIAAFDEFGLWIDEKKIDEGENGFAIFLSDY